MPFSHEILTSLEGRRVGLGHIGNLIINKDNASKDGIEVVTAVTSAQLLALFTTPISVLLAADTGFGHVVKRVTIHKPAGTAYTLGTMTGVVLKYTNAAGAQASGVVNAVGFLDQATAQTRVVDFMGSTGATAGDVAPVDAAALVIHGLIANPSVGTSPLYVRVEAEMVKLAFTS